MFATLALLASFLLADAPAAPRAEPRPVEDTYFGETVRDPYRWLEKLDSADTQAFMKGQAAATRAALDAVPGRDKLLARFMALDAATPARIQWLQPTAGGRIFIGRRAGGEDLAKLYVRDGWNGKDRLLFDPASLTRDTGKTHSLNWFFASPDGKRVAIGASPSGSEQAQLRVLDAATGKLLEGPFDRHMLSAVSWLPDSSGFVHHRMRAVAADADASRRWLHSETLLHRNGTPESADVPVFSDAVVDALAPQDFPIVVLSGGSRWALGLQAGARAEVGVFVAPIADLGKPGIAWRRMFSFDDRIDSVFVRNDSLYALTSKDAPGGRILRVALDGERKIDVVHEGAPDHAIDTIAGAKDALYFRARDGAYEKLMRMPYAGGAPVEIKFDTRGSFVGLGPNDGRIADPALDGLVVSHGTWTRLDVVFRIDPKRDTAIDTGLAPKPRGVDTSNLAVDAVVATAADGTSIPMTVVRSKSTPLDGSGRVLLEGYGSYGVPITAFLDMRMFGWIEHGVMRAYCHVRGGGELGEPWHRGGFHETKANTWRDFEACAEALVAKKYTTAPRLAGLGTSAGGILIGNAIVERPELFGAAIDNVGCTDVLRMTIASPNGPNHYEEFGDPRTADGFKILRESSAYGKVRDGVAYPPLLVMHGVNDPRVDVWISTKFAARMQAASKNPVLLRLDYDAGHGVGSTASARMAEQADWLAFVLWQTGAPDFQPTAPRAASSTNP